MRASNAPPLSNICAASDDLETVSFYDGFNRRIGTDVNGAQTWMVWDSLNLYAQFSGAGSLQERYLFGPAVDEILARTDGSGNTAWYLPDKNGSVRDIVITTGTVQDHVVYDSFGQVVSETNASNGDQFKFDGMQYDSGAALYQHGASYYSASAGRALRPGDPQTFAASCSGENGYVATSNNPLAGFPVAPGGNETFSNPIAFGLLALNEPANGRAPRDQSNAPQSSPTEPPVQIEFTFPLDGPPAIEGTVPARMGHGPAPSAPSKPPTPDTSGGVFMNPRRPDPHVANDLTRFTNNQIKVFRYIDTVKQRARSPEDVLQSISFEDMQQYKAYKKIEKKLWEAAEKEAQNRVDKQSIEMLENQIKMQRLTQELIRERQRTQQLQNAAGNAKANAPQ